MGLEVQNRGGGSQTSLRTPGQDEILTGVSLQGGDRKSKDRDPRVTLEDLGISGSQSFRWQREASVPEEDYVRYVKQANEESRELTSKGLLRLARSVPTRQTSHNGKDPFGRLIDGLKNLPASKSGSPASTPILPGFFGKKTLPLVQEALWIAGQARRRPAGPSASLGPTRVIGVRSRRLAGMGLPIQSRARQKQGPLAIWRLLATGA